MTEALTDRLQPLRELPERLAGMEALDEVGKAVSGAVSEVLPPGSPANTALAGTWLGHPLHPLLTDVTIGAYTGAVLLDLVGGRRGGRAADRLLAVGLLSSAPTVASGINDWSTLQGATQRVGIVHAGANAAANLLFAASLAARRGRHRLRGRVLALAGLGVMSLGGFLGGDLSYRRSVGVDHSRLDEDLEEWTAVIDESAVPEGKPVLARAGDSEILVVRQDGEVRALAARCAHLGGPLHEGEVSDGCVVCPWHQSRFRLSDGEPVSGPTAHPQPALQARIREGRIEVRR